MLKTEPVATASGSAGALLLVIGYAVQSAFPTMPLPVQGAVTVLVAGPIVAVVIAVARKFSFAEDTIREAGLDPAAVVERAADPSVPRCTKGEEEHSTEGPSV